MEAKFKFFGESNFVLPSKVAKSFDKNIKLKGFNIWVSVETSRASFTFTVSEKEMEPDSIVLEKDANVSGRYFVALRGVGHFPFSSLNKKDLAEINSGTATCSFFDVGFDGESGLDAVFDDGSDSISVGAHDQPLAKPSPVIKLIPKLIIRGASNFTVSKKLQKSFDKDYKTEGVSVWISIVTTQDSHSFPVGPTEMRSGAITVKQDTDTPGRYGLEIDCVAELLLTTLNVADLDDIKAGKAECTLRAVAYEDTYMLDASFDSENKTINVQVEN